MHISIYQNGTARGRTKTYNQHDRLPKSCGPRDANIVHDKGKQSD